MNNNYKRAFQAFSYSSCVCSFHFNYKVRNAIFFFLSMNEPQKAELKCLL